MPTLDEIFLLSIDLTNLTNVALKLYSKRATLLFPDEHTFVHYLERIEANSQAIHHLTEELPNNHNLDTSIGLILRSNLSDFLSVAYMSIGKLNSRNDWYDRICRLNYDQFKKITGYMKKSTDIGWLTEEMASDGISILQKQMDGLKNIVSINLDKDKLPTPEHIAKEMLSEPLLKDYAYPAYDLFKFYSQYEHFGLLTAPMQKQGIELNMSRIKKGLYFTYKSVQLCCLNLEIQDKVEGLKDFEDRFDEN
ncbi:MAG: hypothetical protein R8N23_08945 [Reichenbachiella sp.]|uniref:hypothetical protein n=1 Tax=Reichenbachiella sp. TaxID=2184521 RepID=UPI00296641FA|nr:hypothetical protein [Reichenbachiella sp.]MDW3209981.1 hypothetical protein [Reichenbachiella sp.]